ncbi:MAG: hypothetical protein ABFD82_13120 [Syntrophaceae bacterium]
MKKVFCGVLVVLFVLISVSLVMAEKGKMELKVGDEVYVCNCGDKCPCNTMSRNPGNCTCGTEMVKAKVLKVEPGKVEVKAESWDKPRMFKTVGKYTCNCGPSCKCDTISQNPGKCTCGADMIKVVK